MKNFIRLWLFLALITSVCSLQAQMMGATVNSLADDADAHPFDDPQTNDIDESVDGKCWDHSGRCTLRAALEEAGSRGEAADITFGVQGTIQLDSTQGDLLVPDFSLIRGYQQNVILRGYSRTSCTVLGLGEQCYVSGLGIEHGLYGIILGSHNQVGLDDPSLANYIADCAEAGVLMAGDSNIVSGNVIGINSFGQLSPCQFGIFVSGIRNVIGGIHSGEGNLISGNDIGIAAYTLGGFTSILHNLIGTNYNATLVAPNRVGIDNIGPNTYIGSNDLTGANVISGNTESGILIGTMASNVVVQNNYIGTNPQGNISLPNRDGITLGPGSTNCEVHDNLISDNTNNGILISGIQGPQLESDYHLIAGNVIRYNGNAGIALSGAANNNIIGSSLSNDFSLNEIQNNGVAGIVTLSGLGVPTGNTIRKNKIYENNTSGIRILAGQHNIPPPVLLTYVALDQTTATVTGTHPSIGARIDFYLGDPDQADNYEGREWLGEATVNASGHFSEIIPICACDSIVATATDVQGNTSEFSDGLGLTMTAVEDPPGLSHQLIATPNPFDQSTEIHFTLQRAGMVDLTIRNASGKNVATLNHDFLPLGQYNISWSASQFPAGIYYYILTVGTDYSIAGKLIHL